MSTYTIEQQPSPYSPIYNDQVFVVSSSEIGQPSYRYIAKVYIGLEILVFKKNSHPNFGSAVFIPSRIIEQAVTHDIDTASGFQLNVNSATDYYVEFYEEYEISGVLTESVLLATSDVIRTWNACINPLDYQAYDFGSYLLDNGSALNNQLDKSIEADQNAWLYYVAMDLTAGKYAVITTFDSSGISIQQIVAENSFQTDGDTSHHFVRFGCGTGQLNGIDPASITSGTLPIIDPTVASYTISFSDTGDGSGSFDSKTYTFIIADPDCIHETFRLHYLNDIGAFESFNFTKASKHTEEVKRDNYRPVIGALTDSSTYSYSNQDAAEKTYNTVIKDKYHLIANWVSEEQQNQLEQLISSPVRFWNHPTYGLLAIAITNTNYEFLKKVTKKMIPFELDFEITQQRSRQRY